MEEFSISFCFDGNLSRLMLSAFLFLRSYIKKIEDILIRLDLSSEREILETIQSKLEHSRIFIESVSRDFYDVHSVLGTVTFLSFATMKPLELCLGTCGLPMSHVSKLSNEHLFVNQYLFYWALSDFGHIKKRKIK